MNYFMPETINELKADLQKKDNNTFICAGGTDLMIKLRESSNYDFSILDITHIKEMKEINIIEDKIRIGACATMTQLETSQVIQDYIPALAKAASMVGSTQIRNLATIGGNIANAAQCADTMPVLFAYKARAAILNEAGVIQYRELEDLVVGLEKNSLNEKDAILYFEISRSDNYSNFSKIGARKAVTISKVNICLKAEIKDGVIEGPVVYLGSVGVKATKAPIIEGALEGLEIATIDERKLKTAVYEQIECNIPNRSSKHYKKSAAFGIVMDIIEDLKEKQKGV